MDLGLCIVAIAKNEGPFLDEWIAYHKIIGVKHFYIYDNDDTLPLKELLKAHADYVSIIPWAGEHHDIPGRNKQTKAYTHSLSLIREQFEWVAFIDIDEFIVLNDHKDLPTFLSHFSKFDAISLSWRVFGHNGYYSNPNGLITATLTRRMKRVGTQVKTISRINSIHSIESAHHCKLKRGSRWVDAKHSPVNSSQATSKTKVAYINHYMCRSFQNWMSRVARGCVANTPETSDKGNQWRFDEESTLKQFVETIAKDKNEYIDTKMLRYEQAIQSFLNRLNEKKVESAPEFEKGFEACL